jgi:L-2-hydroxycarboxylate dehydrogenase (NAD+)
LYRVKKEFNKLNMKTFKLKNIIKKIFIKNKLSNEHALICAEALINAELVGAPSHGLSRLKMYCDRIEKGVINPRPKIKIKKISQSISHIDGNNSIGFVAANIGIKTAITNAKRTGLGLVAVKNSGHYGLSGYYAEQAVKKNLIVMVFTSAPPAVAPHGALKSLFGTNPICFGTPTGSKIPFILDTSISMINRGKIRVAAREGAKIPEGVALDKYGKPTTDPKKALEGVQLPIAGFRGSGLAWMVDILSGVFTGGNHAGRVKDPFTDFSGPQNIGHLFFVMKPNLFVRNSFNKRIKDNIKTIKRLPKIKGVKEILYPGQNKFNRYKNNLKKEIKISKNISKDLNSLLK